ncbi:MAG: hypothetical protein FWH17_01860 [Oscillospiraceae bacterium]|nr:hypothetical protein [Oscillospiraceae bacterium]
MTLQEKLTKITPVQREKFNTIKDGAGLDAFLTETGIELTADEKAQVLKFIETGKLPLSDEEMDSAAGGADPNVVALWRKSAANEGRGTHVGMTQHGFFGNYWQDARCPSCKVEGSVFSADKSPVMRNPLDYQIFLNVKCYVCNTTMWDATMRPGENLSWGTDSVNNFR